MQDIVNKQAIWSAAKDGDLVKIKKQLPNVSVKDMLSFKYCDKTLVEIAREQGRTKVLSYLSNYLPNAASANQNNLNNNTDDLYNLGGDKFIRGSVKKLLSITLMVPCGLRIYLIAIRQ